MGCIIYTCYPGLVKCPANAIRTPSLENEPGTSDIYSVCFANLVIVHWRSSSLDFFTVLAAAGDIVKIFLVDS